jgi:hypothetical protein
MWPRLRRSDRRDRTSAFIAVEQLEDLQLLSAAAALNTLAAPLVTVVSAGRANAQAQATPLVTNVSPIGHTPAQIAQAYGFNGVTFDNGAIKGSGAGQTIAIVDAYYDPTIASDLSKFDAQFGLQAASFSQFVEQGATTNSGWALETALDVEWAHAMAPGASIDLIEASNSSLGSLLSAVNYARNLANVSVVSMSWGAGEFASETAYDNYFTTPAGHIGITFVASSGDAGAGTTWPSVSPNVLAVGGTSLSTSASGAYASETAWSGSSGGVSSFESEPSYQQSVQSTGARTTPDVAFNADPNSGYAVYDSVPYAGESGWFEVGGTSAGAPQWAALIAIADQGRAISGQGTLANAQSTLYSLPSGDFHDITSGSNGYTATAGYDLVTGRGSPVVNSIVQALGGGATAAAQTTSVAPNTSTTNPGTHTTHSPTSPGSPTSPTSPGSPSDPTSPGSPTKAGSRTLLNLDVVSSATLAQPDLSSVVVNGAVQLPAVTSSWNTTEIPPVSDRLAPLTTGLEDYTLARPLAQAPAITSVVSSPLRGPSLGNNLLGNDLFGNDFGSPFGMPSALPDATTGLSQFALAPVSEEEAIDEVFSAFNVDDLARSVSSSATSFLEQDLSDALSLRAIDAFFASGGLLAQSTTTVESVTHSPDMSKAVFAGVAGSLGVVGLTAAIRNRRRHAAQA